MTESTKGSMSVRMRCTYKISRDQVPLLLDYLSGGGAGWRADAVIVADNEEQATVPADETLRVEVELKRFDGTWSSVLASVAGMLPFLAGSPCLLSIGVPAGWPERSQPLAHGAEGVYRALGVSARRPILMGILKPGWLSPEEAAGLASRLVRAGCDVVKDDELAGDGTHAVARLRHVLPRLAEASVAVGRPCLYVLHANTPEAIEEIERSDASHVSVGCMVVPHAEGFDTLAYARRRLPSRIVFAHPASASPLFSPAVGMVALPRLAGADVVVLPSPFGPLFTKTNFCEDVIREATGAHLWNAPVLPVFGGGVDEVTASRLVSRFGTSIGVAVGAALLRNPAEVVEQAHRLRDALGEASDHSSTPSVSPPDDPPTR